MLNTISLMGRLTAKPELRHTPNDVATTNFTLAVNRAYVKKGEECKADFFDVVAWRNTAEFICRYLNKGDQIVVSGSLQTRTYTDKEGKNRKVVEVLADNVFFAGAKVKEANTEEESNDDFISIGDEDLPF